MKDNRVSRILALAIILSLLMSVIPATPALAATVTVNLTTGPVGTTVNVSGIGFTAGDTHTITFAYGSSFATIVWPTTTMVGATFSANFNVPSVPRGSYTIQTVTTPTGSFSSTFTVTPQITI